MIESTDMTAIWVTLKLAGISTLCLMLLCLPLAWWLAFSRSRLKLVVETLVALPLVLPPTVLGFYLLLLLGPRGPLAPFFELFGMQSLAFTFSGLVIGSIVYSLPFVVQPMQHAFAAIGKRPLEVAATLGAGPFDRFFSVALPMAKPGIIAAAVLGFAHTLGEFGVVLMVGGNIPGETQVLSIAIYDHVEVLEYEKAHWLSAGLLGTSFVMLLLLYGLNHHARLKLQ